MTDKFTPGLKPEEYEINQYEQYKVLGVCDDPNHEKDVVIVTFVDLDGTLRAEFMSTRQNVIGCLKQIRDKPRKCKVWFNLFHTEKEYPEILGGTYTEENDAKTWAVRLSNDIDRFIKTIEIEYEE